MAVTDDQSRKAVSAAVIGNILEWYDFAAYAFVAGIIARKFFPNTDEVTSLMATFMAYGLGFVARPLGGIIIGRWGDTRGRKWALLFTIFLMAASTTVIGLLPTYESIGILAPVLLVLARLAQGFSAGGEWGGATTYIVEWAPENRRGFYGSFQQSTVFAGLLLGSGVAALLTTVLTPGQMDDWGWRLLFLLGGSIGPVGIYMRRTMDETPAYRRLKESSVQAAETSQRPLGLAAKAFGFTVVWTVSVYVLLVYMPSYSQRVLKFSVSDALWANTTGLLLLVLAIPCMGYLSDRIGRKPLLLTSCLAFVVLPYPLFSYLSAGGATLATLIAVQAIFAVSISMFSGPGPAAIAEIFSTAHRSTWMTAGYALSTSIFGGFAPVVSIWLIERFASPVAHTYYLIAAAVCSALVILTLRETAHERLR